MLTRRRQLVDMRKRELQSLSSSCQIIKQYIEEHIKWLTEQIKKLEKSIDECMDKTSGSRLQFNMLKLGGFSKISFVNHKCLV